MDGSMDGKRAACSSGSCGCEVPPVPSSRTRLSSALMRNDTGASSGFVGASRPSRTLKMWAIEDVKCCERSGWKCVMLKSSFSVSERAIRSIGAVCSLARCRGSEYLSA
jgi:hypothetical protein